MLDVADVDKWECTPLTWVIEGMIALENLVLLAAMTQTGKTLLGLYLAWAIASGQRFLDRYETGQFKVLYLVLEDPVRRIRDRLIDMKAAMTKPGQFIVHIAPGFNLGNLSLFTYMEGLIEKEEFKVIFLDTYQRATPGLSSFDDERQSEILHGLSDLTRKHKIAMVVLDHIRKSNNNSRSSRKTISIDDIKGTGGKPQNADSVILLQRESKQLKFECSSKDADGKISMLLNVSAQGAAGPKFQYSGELMASDGGRGSRERRLFDAIRPGEEVSCGELCVRTKSSPATVRRAARVLIDGNQLTTNGKSGRWLRYKRRPDT